METLENFVGGRWVPSRASEFHDVHNPATGETIARTPLSTGADVDAAVAAATKAFPAWRDTPPVARSKILFRFRELLEEHFEDLAATVTREHGKTLEESRGSVRRGIECVEVACGTPSLMMGYGLENIAAGIDCSVIRQPIGVCAAIAPFNFPAMVPLWFLPFAIGTGNTFILKPSEQVPMTQARIARLLESAGLPPGVVNLVHGGREVVEAICDHPDIPAVSFVGSTPVAKAVYLRATNAGKRCQALGGAKNFVVVMPDADLARATEAITESFFGCAGERCLAGSVLVPVGEAHAEARERLEAAAKALVVGDGAQPGVGMGPVISAAHRERVLGYIEKGKAEGARLVVGGGVPSQFPKGFYVEPTLFVDVDPDSTIAQEEIFGPVLAVLRYQDDDDAVRIANNSRYGLSGAVSGGSLERALGVASRIRTGTIAVNGGAWFGADSPFGGYKESGIGREHGLAGFEEYLELKTVGLPADAA